MPLRTLGHIVLAALFVGALSGCSPEAIMDKFTTPEDKARASGFIGNLRDGQLDVIESHLDADLRKPDIRDTLQRMHASIPKGKPDSVKLVGVSTNTHNGVRTSNLTYEYEFGNQWLLINCATRVDGDQVHIVGLNVQALGQSVEEQNRFSLAGKTPLHYSLLIAMLLAAGISLYALVRCARQPALRRKWAWILFILFGFITFNLNWTSGAWVIKPLSFLLFSAGASASPYGPWELSVALPVGALVYLLRHRRNQNAAEQSNSELTSE